MIPTSVHGYMPFVKESTNGVVRVSKEGVVVKESRSSSKEGVVTVTGSLSRKKVLEITSSDKLDDMPDRVKKKILTKDKTWFAVVRALFRRSGERRNTTLSSSCVNKQERTVRQNTPLKRLSRTKEIQYSSPLNENPIRGSQCIYSSVSSMEPLRSKSMRLPMIEEENINVSMLTLNSTENQRPLTEMIDPDLHLERIVPLSDQLKRKMTSEVIITHEQIASLSSSSSDISSSNSVDSLT